MISYDLVPTQLTAEAIDTFRIMAQGVGLDQDRDPIANWGSGLGKWCQQGRGDARVVFRRHFQAFGRRLVSAVV